MFLGLRLRVWWDQDQLTRQLAYGTPELASRELALRAGQLTSRRTRDQLSASIHELLERAERSVPALTSQVPVDRDRVGACHAQLLELADRVGAAEPVTAKGMARALLLLTDPEKPLWGIARADELKSAIIDARDRLDAPAWEIVP